MNPIKASRVIGICDTSWGDNGKGRVTDWMLSYARQIDAPIDIVVRPTGSHNAGHRVLNEYGEFKLNCIPSAVCFPEVIKICGNGMAIHPVWLAKEMETLKSQGILLDNLKISDRAVMILPWYRIIEKLQELAREKKAVGTTQKAVGPTFARQRERTALLLGILRRKQEFREALDTVAFSERAIIQGLCTTLKERYPKEILEIEAEIPDTEEVYKSYLEVEEAIISRLIDSVHYLHNALSHNKRILLEGAQGPGLDINLGTYPYVTSSNTGRAGMLAGSGLGKIDFMLGVTKAYGTRVGNGPFPSEIRDQELSAKIRDIGKEKGTTTGRDRRIGWRDLVYEAQAIRENHIDATVVVKVDVLDGFEKIAVCVGYVQEGKFLCHVPSELGLDTEAILAEFSGFSNPPYAYTLEDLDPHCSSFLETCQRFTGNPLFAVSIGAQRNKIIVIGNKS